MVRDAVCFVHSERDDLHYVGCKLRHLLSLTALGWDIGTYPRDHRRRMAEFLSCLMNPMDDRFIYDLRLVTDPDPDLYTRGTISLALLCRVSGMSADDAEAHGVHLINLLHSYFPEYEFETACVDTIHRFLKPFESRRLVSISRRAGFETLDSLRGRISNPRRLGFTQFESTISSPLPDTGMVFHIFPYIPSTSTFTQIFKYLLLEKVPVAISCRIQPTSLLPHEEEFLEEQITQCERAVQTGLKGSTEDLSLLRPTLHEQARMYQIFQTRFLFGLKDNAALMALEIASPEQIPIPLVDAIGTHVTEPAGGMHNISMEETLEHHLSGGYEVIDQSDDAGAISAFERMDLPGKVYPLAPQRASRLPYLFDSIEAVAAFRLPRATLDNPGGLPVQTWRSKPPPKELPETGRIMGLSIHGGTTQQIRIGVEDRSRHLYTVGQTGTGKTTLLKTMILEDIRSGEGVCVIDPHGDMFREILRKIPAKRMKDVIVLDPTDREYPIGLNLLEYENEDERHFIVQEFCSIITRMMLDEYGEYAGNMLGPVFWQHLRMNLLLTMSNPKSPGTLLEFYNIYQEENYWRRWLPLGIKDPLLEKWIKTILPSTGYLTQPKDSISMGAYLGSKIEGFIFDPMLRYIFGQKRSTINIRNIMDEGKILLVNLAKGEVSSKTAQFFGMVLLAKIMAAALTRVKIPEKERRIFYLYVDEFQSFATEGFITLLSEGRKFGVSLVLANQFISQIRDTRITDAIFGNVGTTISFRVGHEDAEILEKMFFPVFNRFDLGNLPNWHAYMRTLINNQSAPPFSMETLPDSTPEKVGRAIEVREMSRITYGRMKETVDTEIEESLKGPRGKEEEEEE